MLDTTNFAISTLVAHALAHPEAQRELQLAVACVVTNEPAGLTIPQKQLALIVVLEELIKTMPSDYQNSNILAVIGTLLFGTRTLAARSTLMEDA